MIFRPDSPLDRKSIPLRGLAPGHHYWVWSADGSFAPAKKSANDLMHSRLSLHFAARQSSDILFF